MAEDQRKTTTSDRLTTVLSYGTILLLGYLVYLIAVPFLVPLAWSAVLAIFFHPAYVWMSKRMTKGYAATVVTLGVTFLLIVPALCVLLMATKEAVDGSARIQAMISSGADLMPAKPVDWVRSQLPESLQNVDLLGPLRQGAERVAATMASRLGGLLKNLLAFFVNLFILLFALFFMFRDGDKILGALRHLLPFEKDLQESIWKESRDLIFASVAVAILIALIQGFLGGVAFAVTGLPAPVFVGVLIGFCSIIPVVGSALIWIPAALWLGLTGHWGKAVVLAAICGGIAGTADNLVRPLLLRNRTKLNDLLLFLSIVGGLDVFGLLGLVAGPTIVAAALGVFRAYAANRESEDVPAEGPA